MNDIKSPSDRPQGPSNQDVAHSRRRCTKCGKPAPRYAYQLPAGGLIKLNGTGEDFVDPADVIDVTGQLDARSDDVQ